MKKNKGKNVLSKLTKAVKNRSNKGVHPNAISKHVIADNDDNEKSKNLKLTLLYLEKVSYLITCFILNYTLNLENTYLKYILNFSKIAKLLF